MYKVYCDNYLIYDDNLESLNLFDMNVDLELNSVGSFTFTIYPDHPYFSNLQKLKSIIKVYQDNRLIFCGRILNDVNGFYNEKQVTCESDLSYLIDSIQRPYAFEGTPAQLFTQLITNHNAQVNDNHKFIVGNITVTDPNDYITRSDSEYTNTWDSIQDKLIDKLGGYLWVRYEDSGTYIDYLADFNTLSSQTIEFAENLLELSTTVKADDIFTVIIPLGADIESEEEGGEREKLTIKEVNGGLDYLEHSEGISRYGRIVKVVEWSGVTLASNLKTKAQAYLDSSVLLSQTIELSAADLKAVGKNVDHFNLGTKVKVYSKPHNINVTMLVDKLSINLSNPVENKISLGASIQSMTEHQTSALQNALNQIQTSVNNVKVDVIRETTTHVQSMISSSSTEIMATVREEVYTKEEIPQVISSQTSTLTQNVNGWEMRWNNFQTEYNSAQAGIDSKFEKVESYIRYIDGKIILGKTGNQLELRIANNELGFYQNNTRVAYFSDNKLYVTYGEFSDSLQLGKFAFLPRTNGNLSFKKVVN